MAPKPEDNSKNRTLTARMSRLSARIGKGSIGMYASEYIDHVRDGIVDGDKKSNVLAACMITFSPIMFTVFNALPSVGTNVILPDVESQYSFTHDLDENGYLAVSSDDGATGYALFREDDTYRLYNFDARQQDFPGHYVLTLEDEKDRAWYVSRSLHQDFNDLLGATQSTDADFSSPQWEAYSFENLTQYVVDGDSGDVKRFAEALNPEDDVYATIPMQYETLGDVWLSATDAMLEGRTGFAAESMEANVASYSIEKTYTSDGDWDRNLFGGLMGAGLLLFGLNSVGSLRDRRRNIKKEKKYNHLSL